MSRTFRYAVATLCAFALGAAAPPERGLDRVLGRWVDAAGRVDYDGLRRDGLADLDAFLARAAAADPTALSPDARTAFWINVYNARALAAIARRPAMRKVSEDFGLFDERFTAGGRALSLNDIEHRILRGRARNGRPALKDLAPGPLDPRVHFALVCGALDCPRLRSFAYTADNLEATLEENARDFANAPKHLRLEQGRLTVSSLMDWYGEDFSSTGGPAAFLAERLDPARRADAAAVKDALRADFRRARFVYDWTVNRVP